MKTLDPKSMKRAVGGAFALALVLGGCALAGSDSSPSKNNPTAAAHDETPEPNDDVEAVGAPDALGQSKFVLGPAKDALLTSLDGSPIKVSYKVVDGINLSEGDMILPNEILSATSLGRYWPGGVVPYVIDTSLPSNDRAIQAVAHWNSKTSLHFIPRTNERDYVHFRAGGGCSSSIGQQGGRQFINLNTGETSSSVAAIGIDRSVTPERVYWFYKRGFATAGTLKTSDSVSSHFRYILPPGHSLASMIDISIASNGHVFAYFDDSTVSEGTVEDLSAFAAPKPYALAAGHVPADVAGIAIDKSDQVHAYYKDGTFSIGTTDDLAALAEPAPFTVAAGKTPADLSKVEFSGAADSAGMVAFYAEMQDGADGGAPFLKSLPHSSGTADALAATAPALVKTGFTGHCGTGATIHEMGHAIGLFHEQTRHDRDEHVRIIWDNVDPSARFNFEKHSKVVGTDTGEYDFGSIMHYGPTAFSANGGKTIEAIDGHEFQEQRDGLSEGDLVGVAAMYGAKE